MIKTEIPCEEMACYYVTKAKIFAFKSRNLFYQEKKKPNKPIWFCCSTYSKCVALVRRQRKKLVTTEYVFFFYYTMLLIAQPHERWNNLDFHKPPQCWALISSTEHKYHWNVKQQQKLLVNFMEGYSVCIHQCTVMLMWQYVLKNPAVNFSLPIFFHAL